MKIMNVPLQFVVEDFCPSQSLPPTILPQDGGIDLLWKVKVNTLCFWLKTKQRRYEFKETLLHAQKVKIIDNLCYPKNSY